MTLAKKRGTVTVQHRSWLCDMMLMFIYSSIHDITEVFPFVLIRQSWPSFKNACFFVVASDLCDTHVQLRSWRGSIYCRWQWITRTRVRFTFAITMVIDAFEACWPACSEINSHIAETLGQRWRTEEMLKSVNTALWLQPRCHKSEGRGSKRHFSRGWSLSLFRVFWVHYIILFPNWLCILTTNHRDRYSTGASQLLMFSHPNMFRPLCSSESSFNFIQVFAIIGVISFFF